MKHVEKSSLKEELVIEPFLTDLRIEIDSTNKYLFTCCGRLQIKILDIETGKVVKALPPKIPDDGGEEIVNFAISHADGNESLSIAYSSGLLRHFHWNFDPVILVRTWKSFHVGPIAGMLFDPTVAALLATGGCDSTLKVWDTERLYCTHNLKGAGGVISTITFQPKPLPSRYHLLASGDQDNHVVVWDLLTSKLEAKLEGHCSAVTSIKYLNENSTTVISSSRDKIVIIWCLKTFTSLKKYPIFESIESLFILPKKGLEFLNDKNVQGTAFATAGTEGRIKVWDSETGRNLYTQDNSNLKQHDNDGRTLVTQAVFCSSSEEVALVSYENNIIFHSLNDFSLTRQLVGHIDEVLSLKFLGPEEEYLVISTNSSSIKIFDLDTLNCTIIEGHTDLVLSIEVFTSDRNMFASTSKDNTVRVWRFDGSTMTAKCLFRGSGHSHSVASLAIPFKSADWLVTGSEDTTMKIWKIPSVGADSGSEVISLNTIQAVKAHDKDINSIAISPNDKLICTGSQDKMAKLWTVEDNTIELMGVLQGHRKGIWCVRFSPVDQVVATSSADATIRLWALVDLSCLKTYQGHDCSVLSVLFAARGTQLISTASDGNLKLWSVKSNECVKTIDAHQDKTWGLAMTEDEAFVATGAADSRIVIWRDVTESEREEEIQKRDENVQAEQGLLNLMQRRNWTKALKMAIRLEQPFRALTILKEIILEDDEQVDKTLENMREDQLLVLLRYAVNWNTNSKHSLAAQMVIRCVLTHVGTEVLLKQPDSKELVASLLPYTERHFARANRLLQQATFLSFLWENMKLSEDVGASGTQGKEDGEEEEADEIGTGDFGGDDDVMSSTESLDCGGYGSAKRGGALGEPLSV